MKQLLFIFMLLFSLNVFSQKQIFNGKNLSNWEIFLGNPISGYEDLAKMATPESTYHLVKIDGQNAIRISGDILASLATKKEYENYHLRIEFKWGEKVYGRRNSGLLYHSFGPFGASFGTWMANIELQLMHDNLGDTYLMNNTRCETKTNKSDDGKTFFYKPDGDKTVFSEKDNGRSIKKMKDAEKPLGEWNTVDLYCFGQKAIHVVNGEVVMVNENCSTIEDGKIVPLTKGKIQLQSEGGEFYIRKIEIEKIKKLPEGIGK